MAVSTNWEVIFIGVLATTAPKFGVCLSSPHCGKLPCSHQHYYWGVLQMYEVEVTLGTWDRGIAFQYGNPFDLIRNTAQPLVEIIVPEKYTYISIFTHTHTFTHRYTHIHMYTCVYIDIYRGSLMWDVCHLGLAGVCWGKSPHSKANWHRLQISSIICALMLRPTS